MAMLLALFHFKAACLIRIGKSSSVMAYSQRVHLRFGATDFCGAIHIKQQNIKRNNRKRKCSLTCEWTLKV